MSRFVYFFGILLAAFLALGMFQAKTGAGESAETIRKLEKKIADLEKEITVLEKEHDVLSGQDRIARLAAERLGMGPARSYQMVDISNAPEKFGPLVDHEVAE